MEGSGTEEVREERRPKSAASGSKQKKQQTVLLILLILVVAGVVFIFYRNGTIGGGSGEKPVEQYLQAIADKDFEAYTSAMLPLMAEDYRNDLEERGITPTEYMELLYSDYYGEFGDDLSIDIKITGRSRVDSEFVDMFKESYEDIYGEPPKLGRALEIDVAAYFSGSKSSDLIELECYAVKSGGEWYIAGCEYKTEDANLSAEE